MLHIQKFITEHSDWEALLQEKPYCITISRDVKFGHNLIMFKYSQIDSNFNEALVRECRGLILDEDTLEPICVPFFKFGNYGESYCPEIDWKSCWVGEKLDGSLIKMSRIGNDILWSTNGTIDAFKAPLADQIGCVAKSFGELAYFAVLDNYCKARNLSVSDCIDSGCVDSWLKSIVKPGFTYMFELTSPFNKVVVQWRETRLNFLGVRNNETLQETYFSDHELRCIFNTPKVFPLGSIDDCVKAANELDCNNEGFVVCDKNFNRVKIKSPTYVALHHMRNNGVLSYERGIEIVRGNELEEVVTYFPEFKEHLEQIKEKYDLLVSRLEASWDGFSTLVTALAPRKEAAIWITKNFDIPGVGFALLDGKVKSAKEWIEKCPAKNLVKWLGFKEQLT